MESRAHDRGVSDADPNYELLQGRDGVPVKAWVKGVPFEEEAKKQLLNVARLPFVYRWVAAMPDVHLGIGATVGSVIPTVGAIIPAAVGVDIGCGMMATLTTLVASELPDDLKGIRSAIERAVPHGRTNRGGRGDRGAWGDAPDPVAEAWARLEPAYRRLLDRHPSLDRGAPPATQLGTLGTGNHFIEVCLDEKDRVWFLLHSGSRGVGNRIGTQFIEIAKEDMRKAGVDLPDRDLAYLPEGTSHFRDYVEGVGWAQTYAATNRVLMMERIVSSRGVLGRRAALHGRRDRRELPPQLRRERAPLRARGLRDAQGRRARGKGRARASSPAAWARAPTSCAASGTPRASRAVPTAPAGGCPAARPSGASR